MQIRALVLAFSLVASAQAAPVRIKLGTLAPQGSTWHQLLVEMGQKWSQTSNGQVELKIYAGGTQGNEGEMIRKIGIGQLQAAAITAVGMREITPEPQAEDVPFLIDSYEEYDYVHEKLRPKLDEALAKKGYVAIHWGEVGFVYFFSTEPYRTPEEFSKGKIFTWNGDPASEAAWKRAGFRPVVLSATDLIPSLASRMVNIVSQPPLYAFTTHIYERADNMLNLRWGFLTGATLVKKEAWDRIAPDVRQKLLAIADDYGERTRIDVRKQNEEAIEQMKKKGLTINQPANVDEWRQLADRAAEVIRGRVVPTWIYDEVVRLRDEYRAQQKR
jgi:TRAP-type transport system periplasmic protein